MRAMREEFPVEDIFMRLEPRFVRIEGEVTQVNSRFAVFEVDLRDLRKSLDQKFDKLDAKFDKLDARFDKLDAKIDRVDAKFESKLEVMSTRRFTFLAVAISSAATIVAAVLAIVFAGPHGH